MNGYAFFPGCTIPIVLPHLEAVSRRALPEVGIQLVDLPFTCCPTAAVREVDEDAWLVMAARNLAVAEEAGLDIVTLCNGCAQSLREAQRELEDEDRRDRVNARLSEVCRRYSGVVRVHHFAMLLHEMRHSLASRTDGRLAGLRVASHPGCHLLRPSDVMGFDDPERPVKYDEIVAALGATAVEYPGMSQCCGFKMFDADRDASARAIADKVDAAAAAGADVLLVGCPSCFQQFDRNQVVAQRATGRQRTLPVIFLTQLLGLALGFTASEAGLDDHKLSLEGIDGRWR
jgi:heterodisulfide reductase subunit B